MFSRTMPTLFLTPRYTEDAQALWRAAIQLGWDLERLNGWRIPEHLRTVEEPVLYLEGLMAPMLAEQFGLRLLAPPNDWLPNLPETYRQRWVYLTTLGKARQLTEPAFIKPPNDKSFPAQVYKGSELSHDYPNEMPVLVAEIVHWEKEFRCFILDRRLRTFSIYLRDGILQREAGFHCTVSEADEVQTFVKTLLADEQVHLPKTAVIDVGIIRGKGWAVIEQNAAWGAGIYGCQPEQVLNVIRYAAVRA